MEGASAVTIKSDRWIQEMALQHGMIEPFQAEQVRGGVISYGLSSYGYDMRVADEWKVFTNVFNTLVDPKHFDPRSFVDLKADHCDIPPNSFVLARSVEYFRIPRRVLSVVLGKSTYARCFSANTRVALADGTSMSLEELSEQWEQGKAHWGYSIGQHGRIIVTLLEHPRYIGRDALIEVTLDNGEIIQCTPDHEFMLRDGAMLPAASLREGTSLMPLYTNLFRGYEMVYQPLTGYYVPTHRLADEWNIRHQIYEDEPSMHRHHLDHSRCNNMPWNIMRVPAQDHIRYHNSDYYDGPDFDPIEHGRSISEALERRASDPAWRQKYLHDQAERARLFWSDPKYAPVRAQLIDQRTRYWSDEANRLAQRERQNQYWDNEARRRERAEFSRSIWARDNGVRRTAQAEHARSLNLRAEITGERVRWALDTAGSIRGAARLLDCDRAVFRRFPELLADFRGTPGRNHKVAKVTELPGTHDVYCLSVPEAGNFALAAGVFVHNCGLIVNVTPLEPAWQGYVTIEISNTTPLPARVYANEGIAQVLFLESDEECMVSYADKSGKYQNQVGVVPPKMS
jgi:deoxycytidine triphosphate deaminase